MPTASASVPNLADPEVHSRTWGWTPALLCVLLGISAQMSFGPTWVDLRPGYLLPLVAVWWARRDGLTVVVPLGLLSLLPDVFLRIGFLSLSFGYSDVTCLMAAGVALAFAAGDGPAHWLPRFGRPAGGRWGWRRWPRVLAAGDRGRHALRAEGIEVVLDTLALPAVALGLYAMDWRKVASVLGHPAARAATPLAMLVALGLSAQLSLSAGMLSFRLGSASASSLVPAACFVAVLCGWVGWPRTIVTVFVVAVLAQAMLSTVGPFSHWALGARASPAPWMLLIQAGAAALLGAVFHSLRAAAPATPAVRQRALLAAALVSLVLLTPALNRGEVVLWGASLWGLAGAAFLGGRLWRGRGAVGVPLALVAVLMAVALSVAPEANARALASGLPTLSGVMVAYALGGWLSAGLNPAAPTMPARTAMAVDLSAVARVVQAIDHAAVMRAFWALLVPAFAFWQLAGLGVLVDFGLRYGDLSGDAFSWGFIGALGLLIAVWPAGFVVLDWMDRQDRLHAISGVSGALLAFAGAAAIAVALGLGLPALLEDAPTAARAGVSGLLLLGVLAIVLWLQALPHVARILLWAAVATLALLGVAGLAWIAASTPRDQRTEVLLQVVASTVVLLVIVAGWVRAVRLRLVLAESRPRALLFGAVPAGRLWARIAAMLGLPASLWTRAALRQPEAWAFLLSRPLIYLGTACLKMTLPGGLAVIAAGHGAFAAGRRLAARTPWRPQDDADPRPPVLYLRSFEDDQFDFRRPAWQLRLRWFDLWSFRRNVDEAMVDEVALYGPVVALGRPGEVTAPFGAPRYRARHDEWQDVVTRTARRARAIVLVAGESPGLRWEFDLLRREGLLERTVLLLHPDRARTASNRRAIGWLTGDEALGQSLEAIGDAYPVAFVYTPSGHRLLTVDQPSAAAYVVALRAHFQQLTPETLASAVE